MCPFRDLATRSCPPGRKKPPTRGVPDVLPSLQTGLINACYGSPLSTLALQWYTKVKYMTSMHISQAIGATVITKKEYE